MLMAMKIIETGGNTNSRRLNPGEDEETSLALVDAGLAADCS